MNRGIASAVLTAVLAGLFAWQWHRERLVSACESDGGVWNGAHSRCDPPAGRPILQRDLHRS